MYGSAHSVRYILVTNLRVSSQCQIYPGKNLRLSSQCQIYPNNKSTAQLTVSGIKSTARLTVSDISRPEIHGSAHSLRYIQTTNLRLSSWCRIYPGSNPTGELMVSDISRYQIHRSAHGVGYIQITNPWPSSHHQIHPNDQSMTQLCILLHSMAFHLYQLPKLKKTKMKISHRS